MRYAIFTDIHANLEALEAVLAKIDELAKEQPIDQLWFLGDLVGYGPNPNECIAKLRERTDVIIAGNHDWAAVGKLDLEDFSAAARVSAEWTAEQLTEEHREFLRNLPERLEMEDCTLVHGSPYGPLWEYLTSEVLAERSFQYFPTRFCVVGHTHVPVIFQQPDTIANTPTLPLKNTEQNFFASLASNGVDKNHTQDGSTEEVGEAQVQEVDDSDEDETSEMAAIVLPAQQAKLAVQADSAYKDPNSGLTITEEQANSLHEAGLLTTPEETMEPGDGEEESEGEEQEQAVDIADEETDKLDPKDAPDVKADVDAEGEDDPEEASRDEEEDGGEEESFEDGTQEDEENNEAQGDYTSSEEDILNAEDRLNNEIEELLSLLGLSQSLVQVTNEMFSPPEGHWEAPESYRAIINPGGVGQPRDGNPRAAFMIYDTEQGFEFYRVDYEIEKTQEKIIQAGLPQYLAVRLAFGR